MSIDIFARMESEVRYYCRRFPVLFESAKGSWMIAVDGQRYLDLFSGAGSLNYGHNDPAIMDRVIAYIQKDGVVQSLDLHTVAKATFLHVFQEIILAPRGLDYKMQFPGPTGTNAVEAALKLARKVTGRSGIAAFTGSFHGMSLGSLAATYSAKARAVAGVPLYNVSFLPYDGHLGHSTSTMEFIEPMLRGTSSCGEKPAAALIELVQGEGGLSSATAEWAGRLAKLCNELDILLIVDEIQTGCGRTGRYFSFEEVGIVPDIVVLSKSLSGFGAPLSLLLMRRDLDLWDPGEHTGTFRGNNLAFVGASAALELYWSDDIFVRGIATRAKLVRDYLTRTVASLPVGAARIRGRGLLVGLEFGEPAMAGAVSHHMFERRVIIETCGADDQVLKLLPALTIKIEELIQALEVLHSVVLEAAEKYMASTVH